MKKLLSLCMALAMLLTVLVPAAVAEEVTFGYNNYRVGLTLWTFCKRTLNTLPRPWASR